MKKSTQNESTRKKKGLREDVEAELYPISSLWSFSSRELSLSLVQSVAVVEREIARSGIDLFIKVQGVEGWTIEVDKARAMERLHALGRSVLGLAPAVEAEQLEELRISKEGADSVSKNILYISGALPVGSGMKAGHRRAAWVTAQMIDVVTLSQAIADFNETSFEEALGFMWLTVCKKSHIGLYELGGGLPYCIGEAGWITELADLTCLNDHEGDVLRLRQLAFDPIDAETIFMSFPFESGKAPASAGVFARNRHIQPSREDKEVAHQALVTKTAESRERVESLVVSLAKEKPKEFVRWCCELALNEASVGNPLEVLFPNGPEDMMDRVTKRFSFLAQTVLKKSDPTRGSRDAEVQEAEIALKYCNLTEAVLEEMNALGDYLSPKLVEGQSRRIDLLWAVFGGLREALESALTVITEKIWHGLPLYRINAAGEMERVRSEDELYVYLRMCGKHGGMNERYEPPEWFDDYYFSQKDLEIHGWLFNFQHTPDDGEISERKLALLKQLDLDPAPSPSSRGGDSATSMLRLVDVVLSRWYSDRFDPTNRETVPKQADVVEWLMTQHGLSKRQAEAIDIVTRPDLARSK